ncbi:MAG: PQQ-binding-like beta-propeller repeat protein [Proteobacteria bacterium]|nr:PQQ-binding-like beta-propeller repeat protein [Pseudomonadota bacterium]
MAISDEDGFVAFGSTDKYIYFFNRTGDFKWKFKIEGTINRIVISKDGQYVAVGSFMMTVCICSNPTEPFFGKKMLITG